MPTENSASSSVTTCSLPPSDVAREAGELGQKDRAIEPEPGDAEHRLPDDVVAVRDAEILPRFGERIPVDREAGIHGRQRRDETARQVAGDGNRHRDRAGQHRPAPLDGDDEPADDRADEDGDERPHLHEAVAADQLFRLQRFAAGSRI